MKHHHKTDLSHTHGITDGGHSHGVYIANTPANNKVNAVAVGSGGDYVYGFTSFGSANGVYIEASTTGISVNWLSNDNRMSGGSISDVNETPRTQTDSNNQSAAETRPTNFTVKIWKRTA